MDEIPSDVRTVCGRAALRGTLHGILVGAAAAFLLGSGVLGGGGPTEAREPGPGFVAASSNVALQAIP